jgi:hypothetical protein
MNNIFKMFNSFGMFGGAKKLSTYNPLINYDWSTTTTSGLRYLKDIGSTPTYNASMFFGRGAYLNGVDQTITIPINTTIQTALKRVNGVATISEASQTLTNYVISGLGVHKDYYLFTRLLTPSEKDSYTNTPELFYAMAQADNTCVLNMPMCETSSTARNYKTGIDYAITNYTSSVRDNAKNLQYGLQTCNFVRDSLGVIQSASNYLECDGVGYANCGNFLDTQNDFSIEFIGLFKTSTAEQAHGVGYIDAYNRITFSMDTTGKLFSRCGGTIISYDSNSFYNICSSLTLTFNKTLKQFKVYLNGVYAGNYINNNFTLTKSIFIIGAQGSTTYQVNGGVRLFKVHDKELTQAEITANYNSYVAKGLLL